MRREVWSASAKRPADERPPRDPSPAARRSPRGLPRDAVRRLRVRRDGGPGLVGRVHDRGLAARARRAPGTAAADADPRARRDRARRRQLLAPGRALSDRRRLTRSGGARVRHRLGVRADRRADRRFRPHHHDLDRSGGERADRLRPGPCAAAPAARRRHARIRRRADLVRARRPARLRRHDPPVRGRCDRRARPRLHRSRDEPRPRPDDGQYWPGCAGRLALLPGRDGPRDGHRGARNCHRATRATRG